MDDISKMQRDRNRLLMAMAIIFLIWQGSALATDIFDHVGIPLASVTAQMVELLQAAGAIGWVLVTLASLALTRRVKRAQAQDVMTDELFAHRQAQAFRWAYVGVVVAVVALMVAETFHDFTSGIAIRTMLIVVVVSPLTAFVMVSREDGEAPE